MMRPQPTFPGSEQLPDAEDSHRFDPEAGTRRAKQDWYWDHPLCGAMFGCDQCPMSRPNENVGVLFPHCAHPDQHKLKYKP